MVKKKESLKAKVRREWRENIVRKAGCDKNKLNEEIEFANTNIKANQDWVKNFEKSNDPEMNKKVWNKIARSNISKMKKLKKSLERKKECCEIVKKELKK